VQQTQADLEKAPSRVAITRPEDLRDATGFLLDDSEQIYCFRRDRPRRHKAEFNLIRLKLILFGEFTCAPKDSDCKLN
jgi:hypothetical protein